MAPLSFKVNTEYAQISELVPHLFICGVSALTQSNMNAFRITLIINATKEVPNLRFLGEIQRIKLWVDDTTDEDLLPHFGIISDQIHAIILDGGNVLVHCVAGVSRSASICLAYLTKYHCRCLRDAYHLMCAKRPMVRPNLGFWRQLIHFEQLEKGIAGSVRIVRDDAQPEKLLPDVYLKNVIPERPTSDDNRERRLSGPGRAKFFPVLEPLVEMAEANASRQDFTAPPTPVATAPPTPAPVVVSPAMPPTASPAATVAAVPPPSAMIASALVAASPALLVSAAKAIAANPLPSPAPLGL